MSLDRMLRDRIVCGVRSRDVQRRLLSRRDLTLNEAEEVAAAAEAADSEVEQMQRPETKEGAIHKMVKQPSRNVYGREKHLSVAACGRCGSSSHTGENCGHKTKTCFRCGKQGHLARKCRATGYRERSGKPDKEQMSSLLADASAEDDDLCISSVYAIKSQAATVCLVQPVRKKLCWGGIDVSMEIDTGSPVCVIPRNVYLQCRNRWPSLAKSELRLNCYLGKLPILGELHLDVAFQGRTVPANLVVLDCLGPSLCGRDVINKLNLLGAEVASVSAHRDHQDLESLLSDFQDLFEPGLGAIEGPPVHLYLKEGARPKFMKVPTIRPHAAVWYRNFGQGEKWLPGVVESNHGARMTVVSTPGGNVRRHLDQLRLREVKAETSEAPAASGSAVPAPSPRSPADQLARAAAASGSAVPVPSPTSPADQLARAAVPAASAKSPANELYGDATTSSEPEDSCVPFQLRRSTRTRKPIDRLQL
ncbi:uncharacterized protein LOC115331590 isoform X1 [Ixodes scapularis]|uniref:uncharacterized protein LOC115331590 isoform X1 n=2 Tax=Ixodes scapularis TaxID=6945 RepID=UPI0011618111|nr:uncharacterized protein LOC115331590 isoform X1 [Ixodes scapularis]